MNKGDILHWGDIAKNYSDEKLHFRIKLMSKNHSKTKLQKKILSIYKKEFNRRITKTIKELKSRTYSND